MKFSNLTKKALKLRDELKEKLKTNNRQLITLITIIFVASFLFYFKGLFVAATVNNQPIWRLSVDRELEKQAGQKALDSLITKQLVLQEAAKQKTTVSDAEVNQTIKDLEKSLSESGQNLDSLLAQQGLNRNDLKEQIKLQKLVEKMLGKDIKVTDEEITKDYEDNKSSYPANKSFDELKETIKKQLEQDKLNKKTQAWVEELHSKAKINYFVQF